LLANCRGPFGGRLLSPHTAEIVSIGQVDHRLLRTAQKAKGQDATVNSFVMATGARAACLDKVGSYVGGAWRGAPS
jgi:hypothetical protein